MAPLLVGIVFMVLGGAFASVGVTFAMATQRLLEEGERTQGTVVSIERSSSNYYPVFEFSDARERRFRVRSTDSSKSHAPGDPVTVVYDPQEPLAGRIVEIASYAAEIFFVLFGGLFFTVGALLLIFRKRFNANGEWVFGSKG